MKIACAHPGKLGDTLYALPTIKKLSEIHNSKIDFYTSDYCSPLKELFEYQSYIDNFYIAPNYKVDNFGCGAQPYHVPIDQTLYDKIYQLGFRYTPDRPLHQFIAQSVGVSVDKIEYEHPNLFSVPFDEYYVMGAKSGTSFIKIFEEFSHQSKLPVVTIGAYGEGSFGKTYNFCGRSFLQTLDIISKSKGFIGIMSSMLVLANGFNIPKVVIHDNKSWDMRHVIRSEKHFYLVNPSIESINECLAGN